MFFFNKNRKNLTAILAKDLRRLFVAHEIIQKVSKEKEFSKIAVETLNLIEKKMGYLGASISLINNEQKTIQLKYVSQSFLSQFAVKLNFLDQESFRPLSLYDSPHTLTKLAAIEKKIQIDADLKKFIVPPMKDKNANIIQILSLAKCMVAVPIESGDTVIGVLNFVLRKTPEEISENEIKTLNLFINQIGLIIDNRLKYEEIENFNLQLKREIKSATNDLLIQNKNLQSLFSLTSSIAKTLDPDEVARIAVDSLPHNEDMLGGILSFYDAETGIVRVKAVTSSPITDKATSFVGDLTQYSLNIHDPQFATNPSTRVIKSGEPYITPSLAESISPPIPEKVVKMIQKVIKVSATAEYPIFVRGKIFGTIQFFLKNKQAETMDNNFKRMMSTYSLQIGIALENALLYRKSQDTQKALETTLGDLQEARRRERDMVDVMGHELRTPITIARNALLVLDGLNKSSEEQIEKPKLDKYLRMAVDSIRREITLIETMLAATKIEGNRIQLKLEKIDLVKIVLLSIEAHKHMAETKALPIVFNTPHDKEYLVFADEIRTQEIMDNLLSNAIKYTAHGKVEIKITEDSDFCRIDVKDTGVGIGEDDIQKLGKKFFRAQQIINDETREVHPGGTGLGLYVTFELIRLMNGQKWVTSKPGSGSAFSFALPRFKGQETEELDQTFIK